MQHTPLGCHNLQNTPAFENYSNYPRNKMKIIHLPPHKMNFYKYKLLHKYKLHLHKTTVTVPRPGMRTSTITCIILTQSLTR